MGFLSVLPEYLSDVELWVTRIFLLLGILTMGPWTLLLIYDFFLFLTRTATYELPVIGGRARGRQKPKPPTLKERPNGQPRRLSIRLPDPSSIVATTTTDHDHDDKPTVKQQHSSEDGAVKE